MISGGKLKMKSLREQNFQGSFINHIFCKIKVYFAHLNRTPKVISARPVFLQNYEFLAKLLNRKNQSCDESSFQGRGNFHLYPWTEKIQ